MVPNISSADKGPAVPEVEGIKAVEFSSPLLHDFLPVFISFLYGIAVRLVTAMVYGSTDANGSANANLVSLGVDHC